jgi:exodeoxyribonuclease VII large subunit
VERLLQSFSASLNALDARLHSLSPLAVLNRGYALVLSDSGSLVRSTAQIAVGQRLTTRLADGSFTGRVESIPPLTSAPQAPTPTQKRKKPAS